jgi:transcription-repair coupling factor (superfamily II helicase)
VWAKVYEFLKDKELDILVVENEKEAKAASDVALLLDKKHIVFPDFRAKYLDDLRSFKEELDQLKAALYDFYKEPKLIISPYKTIAFSLPSKSYFTQEKLEFGKEIDIESFKERLLKWGYYFVDIVQSKGEVSFRGDIIDIFSPNLKLPVRVSLFDTQIESIRYFEPQTQKSIKEELEDIEIIPAFFNIEDEYEELLEKIESSKADVFEKDLDSLGFWFLKDRENLLKNKRAYFLKEEIKKEVEELYNESSSLLVLKESFNIPSLPEPKEYRDIEVINIDALIEANKDKKIKIIAKNEASVRRSFLKDLTKAEFIYKDIYVNIKGPNELIVSLNPPKKVKKRATLVIDELKKGDYVVHEQHGIGIFEGIREVEILGAKRDFVSIAYQGEDRLLVPVENLELLSRYISDGSVAVVDKLGSGTFIKLKKRVKERLFEIAANLIKVAAKRELSEGKEVVIDPLIKLFQKDAGFEYTQDQKESVEAILKHLSSSKVMDMLLSGDVGFGKTEVAMNAIFAVVKSGYQAALVVPTTLLSNQHYQTLKERFSKYDIKVAKVDRFVSAKKKKEILEALKKGEIDVVVGTHAIFGAKFKNLALVVIDEEHKFGVKQKEKLKELTANVHLLSMSATPIPRSLNMALSRIKDLKELREPPSIREEVRTYVKEYDAKLLKEVMLREFRRGGQVFYIHNSIASIEDKKEELQKLLPQAKILVLHSKISAATTEKELIKFANKEYDILLSTSIVESGIHMPNVNTIIVEGADRFGIADLHQLRGRVGRGAKEGYCYYIVEDKDRLTKEAKKRLLALETNSYLGSGAALAYYDLEIRGGGNIIGAQQSGHIKNIGYTLYLKMLEESIKELTTSKTQEEGVELKLSINAYISKELVNEDRLKLELYRRLSKVKHPDEIREIEEEIEDRFGKLDTPTKNFLDLILVKVLAKDRGISKISNYHQNISIEFLDGRKELLKARSKDEDDILDSLLKRLRK